MKKALLSLGILIGFGAACVAADWQADYSRLLKKYVTASGVKYGEWKANAEDVKSLQGVVGSIGSAPAPGGKGKEALAFYLNAYNAWILHEALEKYPVKSVKDALFTFFMSNRITVAGEKMSFNKLEKDIIRPRFGEPRVHFALNCASRSCPPLRNEAYAASELDSQLEQQARNFINSPKGVTPTADGAQVSKIFDWYKDDFAASGGVLSFINKRLAKLLPANANLTYQEYDWNLNLAK